MLKDINLDEFNNTVLTKGNGITFIPDDEYWQIRNFIINRLVKKKDFWKKYFNSHIRNKIELEKNIEKDITKFLSDNSITKVKAIALIKGTTAKIFLFYKSSNIISKKDKLLFDFDITI